MIPMATQFNTLYDLNLNESWNLVLSCKNCNSFANKSDRMPKKKFIERPSKRNEYFIESTHPLRENIIRIADNILKKRQDFVQKRFEFVTEKRPAIWVPKEILGTPF